MDTTQTPGIVRGASAPRGVERRGAWLWPTLAALVVVAAHAVTVSFDAWVPRPDASAFPFATQLDWLATLLPGVQWPNRLVGLSVAGTALAVALMGRALSRLGLPPAAAALLALVAAGGTALWSEATVPTGLAWLSALSALLLALFPTTPARRVLTGAVTAGIVGVALAVAAGGSGWMSATGASVAALLTEVGAAGSVLALLGLAHPHAASLVATGVAVLGFTAWYGGSAQVAAGIPWTWALVACGSLVVLEWRGRPLTRQRLTWLMLGLLAWMGVQAAGRPWGARAEMTRLRAFWVSRVAEATQRAPLIDTGDEDTRALVAAWTRGLSPGRRRAPTTITADDVDVRGALLLPDTVERARWIGIPPAPAPAPLAPLAEVLSALPRNVIVVAGISAEVSATLTTADWQGLIRLGGRPGAVGPPRAHALMGVTGGRQQGDEVAAPGRAVLARLPGDPVGPEGVPSPLDVRIDVDAHDVLLFERDRVRAVGRHLLVAVYRRNGTLLALWVGAGGRYLGAGDVGAAGPAVTTVADVLPCREAPPNVDLSLDDLPLQGVLGIDVPTGASLSLDTGWPAGQPLAQVRRVGDVATNTPEVPATGTFSLVVSAGTSPFGLDLRGRPERLVWRADAPARLCVAPPVQAALNLTDDTTVPVHPRVDPSFGRGWHDMEPLGGGQYFRWSSGRQATLLWALPAAPPVDAPVTVSLDLQNAGTPTPDDRLRLSVNGTWSDARPVIAGRGLYSWQIPGAAWRAGLNEVLIDTTRVVRPADTLPGADGRVLGVALYGWQVSCQC